MDMSSAHDGFNEVEITEYICLYCTKRCGTAAVLSRHHPVCPLKTIQASGNPTSLEHNASSLMAQSQLPNCPLAPPVLDTHLFDDEDSPQPTPPYISPLINPAIPDSSDDSDDNGFVDVGHTQAVEMTSTEMGLPSDNDSSEDDSNTDSRVSVLNVSALQQRAAMFILSSGPSQKGLSISQTGEYLRSLHENGAVVRKWPTGRVFWDDHFRRQKSVFRQAGKWNKCKLPSYRSDLPEYTAFVRNLPDAIRHVIKNSKLLEKEEDVNWSQHIKLRHSKDYNAQGKRIIYDWQSGDDLEYVAKVFSPASDSDNRVLLPIQLFIDKANVARLNKRSMYPVVLYILCFSGRVRRKLAINVAFIPIVTDYSRTRQRLSDSVGRKARCQAIQDTLKLLLDPLSSSLYLEVDFPDGRCQSVTPFLLSIIADIPEVAVLMSCRYGLRTLHPCPRCDVESSDIGSVGANEVELRTASELCDTYSRIAGLRTQGEQNLFLKQLSLRHPKSYLLSRFEFKLDTEEVLSQMGVRTASHPFGIASSMKFESLHNFDLGLTADLLPAIENYFAVMLDATTSTKIVNSANRHVLLLPRFSSTNKFRLPSGLSIVAESHANMNALNYKSALCILPFVLNGSEKAFNGAGKPLYTLLEFVLSYLELHHFVSQINNLPWYVYDTLQDYVQRKIQKMSTLYMRSIGLTKGRSNGSGPAEIPHSLSTPKWHQLCCHLVMDIKGGGHVAQFDAQAGESHHVDTRAQYGHTSKRDDAEEIVARRATTRELGVLPAMYPIAQTNALSVEPTSNNTPVTEIESSERPTRAKSRRRWTKLEPDILDGMSVLGFQRLLNRSCCGDEQFTFREPVVRVRMMQTAVIFPKYPWISGSGETHHLIRNIESSKRLLRASRSFYTGEPQHDFVEFLYNGERKMVQVRLFFEHPYPDRTEEDGSLMALIRVLIPVDIQEDDTVASSDILCPPETWNVKIIKLLDDHGCFYLRWGVTDEKHHLHALIGSKQLLRPLHITPDFNFPIEIEQGTKLWTEVVAKDVAKDAVRYRPEEQNRKKRIESLAKRGLDTSQVLRTRRMWRFEDGLMEVPSIPEQKFFHNKYMPWTSP